jgi:hypothetical protein
VFIDPFMYDGQSRKEAVAACVRLCPNVCLGCEATWPPRFESTSSEYERGNRLQYLDLVPARLLECSTRGKGK